MSEENIEMVRTYVKVWNAGDMEGVRELYDPGAVMEVVRDWPEPGPFVSRAVMQQLNQGRVLSTIIPTAWASGLYEPASGHSRRRRRRAGGADGAARSGG